MDSSRAGEIRLLKKHPSWATMHEEVVAYQERYLHHLASQVFAGEIPSDLNYKRGFIAGMLAVIRYPDLAERQIAKEISQGKDVDAE